MDVRNNSISDTPPPKFDLQPPTSAYSIVRWTSWWPISFLLPLAFMGFLHKGSITLRGYSYSFENIGHLVGLGSLLGVKIVLAVLLTELLSVGWAASSLRHMLVIRSASWWSDICVHSMMYIHLDQIIGVVLSFGISLFSFRWLHDIFVDATGIQFGLSNFPAAPQFIMSFIIYSFLDYWDHRMVHMRLFWPLHRFHHASTEFYVFTSNRVHPADISSVIVMTGPLVLLGVTPGVLAAVVLFRLYIGLILHSKISGDWGWFGRWVIYSPTGHRMHHLLDDSQPTCNFALIPIWDHLFGTWRGGGSQQSAIGVKTPYRHGAWFFTDLWRDYCDFLGEIRSLFGRPTRG